MTKADSAKGGGPNGAKARRENRLAVALRANLKRRKAGAGKAETGGAELAEVPAPGQENAVDDKQTPDD
jgi:hypothetical protein